MNKQLKYLSLLFFGGNIVFAMNQPLGNAAIVRVEGLEANSSGYYVSLNHNDPYRAYYASNDDDEQPHTPRATQTNPTQEELVSWAQTTTPPRRTRVYPEFFPDAPVMTEVFNRLTPLLKRVLNDRIMELVKEERRSNGNFRIADDILQELNI